MTILAGWIWQGGAIAAATALGLRFFPKLNAATRHAIWWLALVAVLLVPFALLAQLSLATTGVDAGETAAAPIAILLPAIPDAVVVALGVVWLVSFLVGAARIAGGLRQLARLKHESQPFDRSREARLAMWTSIRDAGTPIELRVAEVPGGAGALGLGRPMIAVSPRLIEGMDDTALDQIVLHEHAHLTRRDDWSRLAQTMVASVAGWHPAVRFINRRIDLEREAASDDHVVSRSGALRRYAASLADAAAIVGGRFAAPAVLPTATGSRPTLTTRVQRLCEPHRLHTTALAWPSCAVSVVVVAGLMAAMGRLGPAIGVLESRAIASPIRAAAAQPIDDGLAFRGADERAVTVGSDRTRTTPVEIRTSTRTQRRPSAPTSPATGVTTAAEEPSPAPSGGERVAASLEVTPIEARRLDLGGATVTPPDVQPPAPLTSAAGAREVPWIQIADAGVDVGARAKSSSLAIGDFFTRAGKKVASAFTDTPAP